MRPRGGVGRKRTPLRFGGAPPSSSTWMFPELVSLRSPSGPPPSAPRSRQPFPPAFLVPAPHSFPRRAPQKSPPSAPGRLPPSDARERRGRAEDGGGGRRKMEVSCLHPLQLSSPRVLVVIHRQTPPPPSPLKPPEASAWDPPAVPTCVRRGLHGSSRRSLQPPGRSRALAPLVSPPPLHMEPGRPRPPVARHRRVAIDTLSPPQPPSAPPTGLTTGGELKGRQAAPWVGWPFAGPGAAEEEEEYRGGGRMPRNAPVNPGQLPHDSLHRFKVCEPLRQKEENNKASRLIPYLHQGKANFITP